MNSNQLTLSRSLVGRPKIPFKNQERILSSIVYNLCGQGGLPISTVEQGWFRAFMNDVEPRFQPVSRVAVSGKLDSLYDIEKRSLLSEITQSSKVKPTLTVDFWSGRDSRSFMGSTVHYIHDSHLKNHMLFFVEVPPPHTSDNIKMRFEDELDNCGVCCHQVVTDNAANMKHAFEMVVEDALENADGTSDDEEIDSTDDINYFWTPHPVKVDGWIGCAAHMMQLVVNDGYKELKSYRRVQASFVKAKAISSLSRKSSHFAML